MQVVYRKRLFFFLGANRRGVALVLVLCFVVLLASIIVAFFSKATAEQQISRASANQTKVKLLADGAVDTIIGDVRQEVEAGAAATNKFADGSVFYTITNAAKMVPERTYSGATKTEYANLVSFSGTALYSGAMDRSTNVATTATNSTGRSISKDRWNKPLFLPDTASAKNIFDQVKWITVSRDGTNTATSTQSNLSKNNSVIGRYAYVIYDEGGLLDINAVGYPGSSSGTLWNASKDPASKSALAYADLTQLGLNQTKDIDPLVKWRNAASITSPGYRKYVESNTTGFLRTANTALSGNQSDRLFVSRQQMISFLTDNLGWNKDKLQYFTSFSRGLIQPSFVPGTFNSAPKVNQRVSGGNTAVTASGVDGTQIINPSFLSMRVASNFTRNDGSKAVVGEPLVNKCFWHLYTKRIKPFRNRRILKPLKIQQFTEKRIFTLYSLLSFPLSTSIYKDISLRG